MNKMLLLLPLVSLLIAGETTATYNIAGMMCNKNCPMKVKQSLNGIDGVKICNVNFESKTATVTFDDEKISREKIANTIAKGTYYQVSDTDNKSWSFFGWLFGKN